MADRVVLSLFAQRARRGANYRPRAELALRVWLDRWPGCWSYSDRAAGSKRMQQPTTREASLFREFHSGSRLRHALNEKGGQHSLPACTPTPTTFSPMVGNLLGHKTRQPQFMIASGRASLFWCFTTGSPTTTRQSPVTVADVPCSCRTATVIHVATLAMTMPGTQRARKRLDLREILRSHAEPRAVGACCNLPKPRNYRHRQCRAKINCESPIECSPADCARRDWPRRP